MNENEKFEVKDNREKEWYKAKNEFIDEYAKYLGIYAVGVYHSLCRHANKEKKCFPSIKKIKEELAIGKNSTIESVKRLEFFNIIEKIRIGKKCTNRYVLNKKSEWKPTNEVCLKDFSEVCHINLTSLRDKLHGFATQTSIVRRLKKEDSNYSVGKADKRSNPIVDEILTSMNSSSGQQNKKPEIFNFNSVLEKMINDKQKHIQVVGTYWKWLGWNFENKEQYQSALKRDLRAASILKGYSLSRIKRTFKKLDGDSDNGEKFAWNLNTVHKTIDNVK